MLRVRNRHPVMIPLQMITGHKLSATPYTSHTIVLMNTISIIIKLKSPALRVFQVLYTCGKNVTLLRNAPSRPAPSVQFMAFEFPPKKTHFPEIVDKPPPPTQ